MNIRFFCPRWGSEHIHWPNFLKKVRLAGFDGVEWAIPSGAPKSELDAVWNLAEKAGMPLIAQHYDTTCSDFNRHLDAYSGWLERISAYPAVLVNSQTGKDWFTFEQNLMLLKVGADMRLPIVHETHRGKFSFAAHITKSYLEALPDLRLTLDVSHWVCVAESLLTDQREAMNKAIEQAGHIHARVGYTQGPQAPEPYDPRCKDALEFHLACWDKVAGLKAKAGEALTITPEYGPYPYSLRKSPARQWAVNNWMLHLLRERYRA